MRTNCDTPTTAPAEFRFNLDYQRLNKTGYFFHTPGYLNKNSPFGFKQNLVLSMYSQIYWFVNILKFQHNLMFRTGITTKNALLARTAP